MYTVSMQITLDRIDLHYCTVLLHFNKQQLAQVAVTLTYMVTYILVKVLTTASWPFCASKKDNVVPTKIMY